MLYWQYFELKKNTISKKKIHVIDLQETIFILTTYKPEFLGYLKRVMQTIHNSDI